MSNTKIASDHKSCRNDFPGSSDQFNVSRIKSEVIELRE